jgi:uncharacterized protein YukE
VVRIPDAVHELVEWEIAVAYDQGYQAALADIAAGHAELSAAWRPAGRRRYEQKVAERIAEMRRCARALRSELDRRADRHRDADWPPVAVPGPQRARAA